VIYGRGRAPGGVAFLICAALFFLWLALLMRRQPRTTLDGTILTLKLPLRHERSCDLAQVKSAQVTFGTAKLGDGRTGQIGTMKTSELRLEGGGDLTVLILRPGLR